jgi:hypothetical protein
MSDLGQGVKFIMNGGVEPTTLGPLGTNTPNSSNVNLYIHGSEYTQLGDGVNLWLSGSSAGTKFEFKTLPMFLIGDIFGNKLNLFIKTDPPSPFVSGSMNLVLVGEGKHFSDGVPLVMWGSSAEYSLSLNALTIEQLQTLSINELYTLPLYSDDVFTGYHQSLGLDLYIQGEGLYENAFVERSYLNLFIQSSPGSSNSLPLFLTGSPIGELLLYTYGILGFITNSLPLYLRNDEDRLKKLNLFIRGYK